MLNWLAPVAGEALKGGVSSPSSATSKADAWFSAGSNFTVNTGGGGMSWLTGAALAALVVVALVALKGRR